MMEKKAILRNRLTGVLHVSVFLLFAFPVFISFAQQRDFATELQASYGLKPWRGGTITLGEKVRFTEGSTRYSQSKTSLFVQQSLFRRQLGLHDLRFRLGGGYTFINRLTDPYGNPYYENQHRFTLQGLLARDYGFWRFGSRLRLQSTFRDAARGNYRYNPKLAARLRLSATYALPDRPWKFGANAECFYRLNDPRGSFLDEMRYTLSATRLLDRYQSISLYTKYYHELNVANPLRMLAVGLAYDFE